MEPRRPPTTNERRHQIFSQTGSLQALPKKFPSLEVRGQLMQSNSCRFWATFSYVLSVTDFDPKGTISEIRVHSVARFGHAERWSIAKWKFSTKGLFDHHFYLLNIQRISQQGWSALISWIFVYCWYFRMVKVYLWWDCVCVCARVVRVQF